MIPNLCFLPLLNLKSPAHLYSMYQPFLWNLHYLDSTPCIMCIQPASPCINKSFNLANYLLHFSYFPISNGQEIHDLSQYYAINNSE